MLKRFILLVGSLTALNAIAADSPKVPVAGQTTWIVSVDELSTVAEGYSAKKSILGRKIFNGTDKGAIGTVGDIIITPDKSLSYAIVDVGGFLGIGTKHIAIPAGAFKVVNGKLTLADATKTTLEGSPEFHYLK